MAQKDLSSPLPDTPMADLIRSLSAKYPGRFLLIDFWGMGCGPCRAAIQDSKDKRAEIARRDDVKRMQEDTVVSCIRFVVSGPVRSIPRRRWRSAAVWHWLPSRR